jgi:hypothetical protein
LLQRQMISIRVSFNMITYDLWLKC